MVLDAEVDVEELGEEVKVFFAVGVVESGAFSSCYEGFGFGGASRLPGFEEVLVCVFV